MDQSLLKFKSGLENASKVLQKSRNVSSGISSDQRAAIERFLPYAGSEALMEDAAELGTGSFKRDNISEEVPEPEEPEEKDSLDDATIKRLVLEVIIMLKKAKAPVSLQQVSGKLSLPVLQHPKLLKKIISNDKIQYDESAKMLSYSTAFNVRSKEDILRLVNSQVYEGGVEAIDLADTFSTYLEKIVELEKEKEILLVRNKDNEPRVLYYNNPEFRIEIEDQFKEMWHELRFSHAFDLAGELEAAGMQSSVDALMKRQAAAQIEAASATQRAILQARSRKSGRTSKRVKITNTHIEGLDLTKDYKPERK